MTVDEPSRSEPPATLEARVARQETAEQARALIAAYGRVIDAQDVNGLRAIFAPEFVLTAGDQSFNGLDDVVGFFAGYWSSAPVTRRHFITNVAMDDVSGTGAVATSYFLFVAAAEGTPTIGWGTYRDTFERQGDGVLRFTAKHIGLELEVDVREGWAAELARAAGRLT